MKFRTTWLELWLVVKLKFTRPSGYWLLLSWTTRDDSGTVELELMVVPVGVVRDTGFREKARVGLVGVVRFAVLEFGGVDGGVVSANVVTVTILLKLPLPTSFLAATLKS